MKKYILGIFSLTMLLMASSLFAQEATPPTGDQGMWQTIIMIGIAVLFFYFILWRPEQKRRKALEEQRDRLRKGDRVNAMGIIGIVHRVQEQTVILKMYDGAKIEVLRGAITEVTEPSSEPTEKATSE